MVSKPFPAYRGDEPYLFASYAHEDAELVFAELTWLREQGFNVWYDEGIEPGTRWSDELAKALSNASVLLFFVTPRAVASHHCLDEVNFALDQKKPTIAIHLTPTDLTPGLKLRLSSHQAILKSEHQLAGYRQKLKRVLTERVSPQQPGVIQGSATATTETAPEATPESASDAAPPTRRGLVFGGALVAILSAFAVAGYVVLNPATEHQTASSAVPAPEAVVEIKPTIAVLPFENLSSSDENAFFCGGDA